jgi:L-threonylcarbamoyladenylate synthase
MGRIIAINPLNPSASAISSVAEVVRAGGVIVYPTDTLYGLGCLPRDARAVERVLAIKQREETKGFLLLIPDLNWVTTLASTVPGKFYRLAAKFWPGAVTFLLPANPNLPACVRGERDLVGLRNPDSPYLRRLMKAIPGPLVSTSANVSGQASPASVEELKTLLLDQVDVFVDGGDVIDPLPSTVVDLSVTPPKVVRAGRLSERIEQVLGTAEY